MNSRGLLNSDDDTQVIIAGQRYCVQVTTWMGMQESPFRDGTRTNVDIKVVNPRTGSELTFSGLLPEMIERYGFYEGTGTPYRVAPAEISSLFEHLALPSRQLNDGPERQL